MVRECWGHSAPDFERTIEITDGPNSVFMTPEQLAELIAQVRLSEAELEAEGLSP